MSTFTPNLNFELPTPGSDDAAWGGMLNGNWSALDTLLDAMQTQIAALEAAAEARKIPVGGLYLSTTDTDPATTLGYGTWAAHAAGRALIGVGNNGERNWTAGLTAGAENVTLTEANMPNHQHAGNVTVSGVTNTPTLSGGIDIPRQNTDEENILSNASGIVTRVPGSTTNLNKLANSGAGADRMRIAIDASHSHTVVASGAFTTDLRGGNTAHNNVQPSIGVYVWRRTA